MRELVRLPGRVVPVHNLVVVSHFMILQFVRGGVLGVGGTREG